MGIDNPLFKLEHTYNFSLYSQDQKRGEVLFTLKLRNQTAEEEEYNKTDLVKVV